MVWGKRFLSVTVRALVLAACVVQAIAPDSKDMASLRGLCVLCQLAVPLENCGYDSDEDDAAVCETNCHELKSVLRKVANRPSHLAARPRSSNLTRCAAGPMLSETVVGPASKRLPLCLSLCRLVC